MPAERHQQANAIVIQQVHQYVQAHTDVREEENLRGSDVQAAAIPCDEYRDGGEDERQQRVRENAAGPLFGLIKGEQCSMLTNSHPLRGASRSIAASTGRHLCL